MNDLSRKSQSGDTDTNELIEVLAEQAHESWRGWMRWLKLKAHTDVKRDTLTFQASDIYRWEQQVGAGYHDLPIEQRESDKEEAQKIIDALGRVGYTISKSPK